MKIIEPIIRREGIQKAIHGEIGKAKHVERRAGKGSKGCEEDKHKTRRPGDTAKGRR